MSDIGLNISLNGILHEVDSIVDCSQASIGKERKLKLEMCCECCAGRSFWLAESTVLKSGNKPLVDLALQTFDMHKEGLDIASRAKGVNFEDDFLDQLDNLSLNVQVGMNQFEDVKEEEYVSKTQFADPFEENDDSEEEICYEKPSM